MKTRGRLAPCIPMRGLTNETDTKVTTPRRPRTFASRASTFRKLTAPTVVDIGIKRERLDGSALIAEEPNQPHKSNMIKIACIVLFMAAVASAGILPAAPFVAAPAAVAAVPAPIVTARSSQVIARNYNTFAAAPLAAYAAAVPAAIHATIPAAPAAPITLAAAAHAAPLPYAALTYTL